MAREMERIARVLRVNPATVRKGLEQGVLPFQLNKFFKVSKGD